MKTELARTTESTGPPRTLASSALRRLEVWELELDHRRLRKLAGGQDDAWWVSGQGEVAGPMRLRGVFRLLVEGQSPVEAVFFPATRNGAVIGKMKASAGSVVQLIEFWEPKTSTLWLRGFRRLNTTTTPWFI